MRSETVTRLRDPGALSSYSGQESIPDPEFPAELEIDTLAPAEPRASTEPAAAARDAVTDGWTLYLSVDADVTAGDRMRVRGEVYDVIGTPALWAGAGLVVECGRETG